MPRKGYKNLTIPAPTHARLKQKYESMKGELAKQGITTLGGYCTIILEEMLEKENLSTV